MDDQKILDQVKQLGVLEHKLSRMWELMERVWYIVDPPLNETPKVPHVVFIEDLRLALRELDDLIPYPTMKGYLPARQSALPPRRYPHGMGNVEEIVHQEE